jgi:hypothetical protein
VKTLKERIQKVLESCPMRRCGVLSEAEIHATYAEEFLKLAEIPEAREQALKYATEACESAEGSLDFDDEE